MAMQTILGAGGAVGKELAKELLPYSSRIKLVSRNPKKVNNFDELLAADLTDAKAVDHAVKGSEIVYLVAGLPYKIKIWQEQWPKIMQNVIQACKQHNTRLVFFDNIYMYDPNSLGNLTENSPVNPSSEKGKVRAQIANMLMKEVKEGRLTAMIVRSADFYGPGVDTSVVMETVYKNFKKGRKALWMGDVTKVHSITYVPDAAKATALLGNTPDAYNQVWHLPTSPERITGLELIRLFAKEMNRSPKFSTISPGFIKFLGLFNSLMREMYEMIYQYDRDYFFNSRKFMHRFPGFPVTSYMDGIKEVVTAGKKKPEPNSESM
jgi:nucleoside-diphosphate-sugar epimerase